jgi:hypothetical protein
MGPLLAHFSKLNHVIYDLCQIMSFMTNQSFMSNYVIHMSNHVFHVKSWHSCQIMSCHSCHVSLGLSRTKFRIVGREGGKGRGVKHVFLGLRRQPRCQAERKNSNVIKSCCRDGIRSGTCAVFLLLGREMRVREREQS